MTTARCTTIRSYNNAFRWFVLIVAAAGSFCGAARAASVVTDRVVSTADQTQANVPVTFGQIFKNGDVAKGDGLQATLNGRPVPLQVDVKATNPNGSLRHAVLTAVVPTLPGGASAPLVISATRSSASGASVTLAQVLATPYDASASIDLNGATYMAHARALLAVANQAHNCKPWGRECNIWLAGPLVGEWVVSGPLTNAAGVAQPNLTVYFDVRAYAGPAGGPVVRIRTDIVVENTSAYSPQAQPQYTATLTSGTTHYTSPALTQYVHTRWHEVLWWNDAKPQVYLQQDTQYIQNSMAVSRYETLRPGQAFLAKVRQSCPPLQHCDQTKTMGNAGEQQAIGPLPRWTSVYVVYPDIRAYNWMLANTDALGAYSIHYRDQATGWPVSIQKHPYATVVNRAAAWQASKQSSAKGKLYKDDLLAECGKLCGPHNPNVWDNAHQPAEGYVAYMVTGSYYYMEEVAFGASHNEIWSNEGYRGFSKGLIGRPHDQIRGKAWVLREMADAAYILPDKYPLKAEFNADVENSLAVWNAKYTNNPGANPISVINSGAVYNAQGGTHNGMAPWQHSFLTWSAGHAAELGFAGAEEFRKWLAKFEIGLMTDWQGNPTHGYCWLEASTYSIQVKDSGHWLPSYTAVYEASFPSLVGLACNSPAMVAQVGKTHKKHWQAGEMIGYPYAATGYPANLQIGLASAVDSGLPNAAAAWGIFDSRSVKPEGSKGYNNYPNFALIPRSVPVSREAQR